MDRIKRLSENILEVHRKHFTTDFERNKKVLDKVSEVRSRQLRNEIAGFITKIMREYDAESGKKSSE
jgi:small subunit ribosomal protein S17e